LRGGCAPSRYALPFLRHGENTQFVQALYSSPHDPVPSVIYKEKGGNLMRGGCAPVRYAQGKPSRYVLPF